MLDYLKGKLTQIHSDSITVEIFGIGFRIIIPQKLFASLPALSDEVVLHTCLVMREFSQTIYGFIDVNERQLFAQLIDISGIGPKIAINIISTLSFDALYQSCLSKDHKVLCSVPGIGKKTAERLVIELKDTLSKCTHVSLTTPFSSLAQDATQALINLGYSQVTAQRAIHKALAQGKTQDLATVVTAALREV